jgi:hypothetical protein
LQDYRCFAQLLTMGTVLGPDPNQDQAIDKAG